MHKRGRLKSTQVPEYRRELLKMFNELEAAGLACTPSKIGEREIEWLLNENWAKNAVRTRRWKLTILNGFLKRHQNTVISQMQLGWPLNARVNVEWLSPEESVILMDAAVGVERIVLHLELHLGLRRCEVRNLRMQDIGMGWLQITGKGRGEGKPRTIAWAPETYSELPAWLEERERLIEKARKDLGPGIADPEHLVIYYHMRKLSGYSDNGLDRVMERVVARTRIDKPGLHHRNRRTWGRLTMEAAGKDNQKALLIVSETYGHEDLKQTRKYLGLAINEQQDVQEKRSEYVQRIRERMKKGLPPEKDFSMRISR